MNQPLLSFEQSVHDAEGAAKEIAARAKAEAKRKEELNKVGRRALREFARKQRSRHARNYSGIRAFCRWLWWRV
jgi:hypothetical protein